MTIKFQFNLLGKAALGPYSTSTNAAVEAQQQHASCTRCSEVKSRQLLALCFSFILLIIVSLNLFRCATLRIFHSKNAKLKVSKQKNVLVSSTWELRLLGCLGQNYLGQVCDFNCAAKKYLKIQ